MMSGHKSAKQGAKKEKHASHSALPPIGAGTGAITVPLRAQQVRKWVVKGVDQINSLGAGLVLWVSSGNNTISPSVTWLSNSGLWADIAALSDQYRIDSVRVRGIPVNRYNRPTTSNLCSGAFALDADGIVGTNFTTLPQVLSYSTSRSFCFSDPFEIEWVIPQPSAAVWYDVATVATSASQATVLGFFTDGLITAASGPMMAVHWELGLTTRGTRQ